MYAVEWSESAVEDLTARVHSRAVAYQLFEVSKKALNRYFKPWGGVTPPLYWRRGVLPEDEARFDLKGSTGVNGSAEQAWDYVLIYKRKPNGGLPWPVAYIVLGIASNSDYVDAMTKVS
jgi:hypothetical protein